MSLPAIHSAVVISAASFGAIFTLAWFLLDLFWAHQRRAEERLDRFQDGPYTGANQSGEGLAKVSSAMGEWLTRTTPQFARPLQPKSEADASKLRLRVMHAGFRSDKAVTVYLGLKAFCCLTAFLAAGGWVLLSVGPGREGLIRLVLVLAGAFLLPDLVLMVLTARRKQAIFLGLPDALDLLVISVEAGLGLDQAMRKVASELKRSHPLLAGEFDIANSQLHMGIVRIQVLRDLAKRNGEPDLDSLASVLIQACKFGSGIALALRTQSEAMRIRRRQIAEEKAAKCAVKLIFPLVLFIFPAIFVVLVGPAAISIIRNFLPLAGS
jgi:tight adherence protein C